MNGMGQQYSGSMSAYDPRSAYYNPYALGNQPFFIPSGYGQGQTPMGYGGQAPVSQAIMGGMGWGGQGMGLPTFQGIPGGAGAFTGQDPRYFTGYAAPAGLMQQQYGLQQSAIGTAIERAKGLLGGMGIPAEGGLGDLETWAQQKAALEAEPVRRQEQSALRAISDLWARKGSALGSEAERNIAEVRGASLAALRSSVIGAAIDAYMKRPQLLAQLIGAAR